MKGERGLRSVSVATGFSGTSTIRFAGSGSVPAAALVSGMYNPPALRTFGAVADSTTLIHGVHLIVEKYIAAPRISSSVMALAKVIIALVLALRRSALARLPSRMSC